MSNENNMAEFAKLYGQKENQILVMLKTNTDEDPGSVSISGLKAWAFVI